ncbi:HIT family protein [Salinarimonas rosea]|uniref:HIT family protein n=1 Tax=Salinarimonas rosea TaxID=552063 RepID=UPI0003F5C528|nr:HIT family protein [Salinarimonas rosea]
MAEDRVDPHCPFCRIARREIGASIVCEDARLVAFLDIMPIRPGHVQIAPKAHYPTFEVLPPDLAAEILALGQRLARSMKRLYGVERVAFLFSGGDVAHAHAHLVPMHEKTDITSRRYIADEDLSFQALPRAGSDELEETARALRGALATEDGAVQP